MRSDRPGRHPLLSDSAALVHRAAERLFEGGLDLGAGSQRLLPGSAVLLLLCERGGREGRSPQPCVVLNKRSRDVRQPGDLCFPGGGISARADWLLSWLLRVPGSPLRRWPCHARWRKEGGDPRLAVILAAALREAFEEMRLAPWGTTLLGLLPPQGSRTIDRAVHPVAAWLRHPQRFRPNWEVERVIVVPLADLLDPARHGRLRVRYRSGEPSVQDRLREEFGCFEYEGELLWGLTYRVVEQFLELVLGYEPAPLATRPLYEMDLVDDYFTRRRGGATSGRG